jgi:diguanylate cyclase (GGDEF)-like protein/PAS domain S-box-containing protein
LLQEAGYAVETASDGATALDACRASLPDLVLADVMMPHMDGLALLKELRADPRTTRVPIILLSARAGEDARIEGLAAGADDYLTKPFHARELVARIEGAIRLAKERERGYESLRQAATVFANTNEAIIVSDSDGDIVTVNAAFTRITGFAAEEVVGRNPRLQQSGRHDEAFYKAMWGALASAGQWQGEIWNRRKSGEIYPAWENVSAVKDERGRVINYVSIFSDISAIKEVEQRVAYLAHHDALTDLPNRLLFAASLDQALERAKRHQQKVGLLLVDLDRFKLVNDTLGHAAGDQLLQTVAQRLRRCVRAEDTVARLGGDEFAVVLDELTHPEDAALLAAKMIRSIVEPIVLAGRDVVTSASIGISIYPDDALGGENLVKAADAAMYRAKGRGRHTYDFYTPDLTAHALERLALEVDLRRGLANSEFELYYQPQIELATGRIAGVEALLRWNHPSKGMVLPDQFITAAEECGLIEPIGDWVIGEAFSHAATWAAHGLGPIRIAVNLSGRQMLYDHVVETVDEGLRRHAGELDRVQLQIEITESVLVSSEHNADVLQSLRARGVSIAIDDFGTGYSSLSQLKHLPIDTLKIAKSFIQNILAAPGDSAIASAIISMGHDLGLKVIAEGVATDEQLAFLRNQGCDEAQGYLICVPVRADQVAELLRAARPAPRSLAT